jgi:hypothetical protein
MAAARDEGSSEASYQPAAHGPAALLPEPPGPRDTAETGTDDDYRHKKRRGKSIFDIFRLRPWFDGGGRRVAPGPFCSPGYKPRSPSRYSGSVQALPFAS